MSVSTSYARALYEAAREQNLSSASIGMMEEQMDALQAVFDLSKETQVALLGPLTSIREKLAILESFGKKLEFPPLLIQFVGLLAKKGRLNLLKEIRNSLSSVRLTLEGGVLGHLVSADPIGKADIDILAKALSQKFGKKVAFRVSTDASLLAGMKVTVNGVTYDGTLRSQIQKLRDQFVAGLPGVQA